MQLSLSSWSLPACALAEAAAISKALGIGALDVGHHYRSALDRAEMIADPMAVAEKVRALDICVPNYYHHFGETMEDRNLSLPGTIERNAGDLEKVLAFADAADIPTVFFLPGIINAGQSRREALEASVESLKALSAVAGHFRAKICIEPHMRSFAESPALAREIVERTGVGLALDYSHFVFAGYRQDDIDPLAELAVHVHLRQARAGVLQAKFGEGSINFPALFGTLRDAGYAGALSIEYVHQGFINAWFEDVLTETVTMRDCYNSWKEGL